MLRKLILCSQPIIKANGPPVELVSVAERQEAVPEKLLCYDQRLGTQPQGAKHGVVFASHGTICLRYTCVAVQVWLRAGCESWYCYFLNTTGAVGLQPNYLAIKVPEVKAKTMMSLLILPALLVKVPYFWSCRMCHMSTMLFFCLWVGSIFWNCFSTIFLTAESVNLQNTE